MCAAAWKIRVQTDVPVVRDRAVDRVMAALEDEVDVATGIDLVRVVGRLIWLAPKKLPRERHMIVAGGGGVCSRPATRWDGGDAGRRGQGSRRDVPTSK